MSERTIVIVEDDRALRAAMTRALRLNDYRVETADSAHEARQLLAGLEGEPDLIIMDVVLPGLSGAEAANLFQAHHPDLKILFTSGYARSEASLAPGAPFLRKPFDIPELVRAVEEAVEG